MEVFVNELREKGRRKGKGKKERRRDTHNAHDMS